MPAVQTSAALGTYLIDGDPVFVGMMLQYGAMPTNYPDPDPDPDPDLDVSILHHSLVYMEAILQSQ